VRGAIGSDHATASRVVHPDYRFEPPRRSTPATSRNVLPAPASGPGLRHPELPDPSRDASGHVAFGHGIHYCLGASLARLPGPILDADPAALPARRDLRARGLGELPVRW
jgi:hypothetical protein